MSPRAMIASVFRGDSVLTLDTVAVPDVDGDGVLVEVSHCGICGTDLHMFIENWAPPGSVGGHEWSGVVADVGSEAAKAGWKVGDRVVGGPSRGCAACRPCLAGEAQLCVHRGKGAPTVGAFAQYKAARCDGLYRVPGALDMRTAALTEPLAVALHAIERSGVRPGDRVLVTGAGPIGQLVIAVLRARGIGDVVVSEPALARRERAAALGAPAIAPEQLPAAPDHPLDLVIDPYDVVFECSGRRDATEATLGLLGRHGVFVLCGTGRDRPRLDAIRAITNELVITGACEYTPDDFDRSIELLADGQLPIELLVEPEDVPLGSLQHAMERLVAGEVAGKLLVVPGIR